MGGAGFRGQAFHEWGGGLGRGSPAASRIWVWPFHNRWPSKVEEDLGRGLFLALVWFRDRRHISWCRSIMPG